MVDSESTGGMPSFEDAFGGEDVEQRVYGSILGTRGPVTASTVADRSDCDPKTARKYLRWFANLGIVTRHEGRPTTYERNDAYFEWRRVDRLAGDHSLEELQQRASELTAKIASYEDQYEAASPSAIDAVAVAETIDDGSIDEVYADLADWMTALRERERYERARQQRADAAEYGSVSG